MKPSNNLLTKALIFTSIFLQSIAHADSILLLNPNTTLHVTCGGSHVAETDLIKRNKEQLTILEDYIARDYMVSNIKMVELNKLKRVLEQLIDAIEETDYPG